MRIFIAGAGGASRFISRSIAFAYAPRRSEPAAENEPLYVDGPGALSGVVRAIDSSERSVIDQADLQGLVLRYGYFYGPGTIYAPEGAMSVDVRRGRVPIIGDGGGVFSFIHIGDAAAATSHAVSRGSSKRYNIVDVDPAPLRDWLPRFAETIGARRPRRVPRFLGRLAEGAHGVYFMTGQRGASNARAKGELGWKPDHPSWRDALGTGR